MSSRKIFINDTEIERGRGDASDSSESSPVNKRKRDLSPPSDDDVVVTPTADNETPPPSERPLVREPVAFSSFTANINTYQASLPPVLNSRYLPGQKPSNDKGKKKRNKRSTPFSAQTHRFRAEAYAHNSSSSQTDDTPLQQGQGPYNSLYRATDDLTFSTLDCAAFAESKSPQPQSSPERPSSKRTKRSASEKDLIANANLLSMPEPVPYPLQVDAFNDELPQHSSGESRTVSIDSRQPPANQSVLSSEQIRPNHPPAQTHLSTTSDERTNHDRRSPPAKRPGFHNRMITVLIHDTRSGKIDRQLAEVTIPIKMADDPRDGFWADAKDITEKLQSGPSRIDGPAKVYTLRGKYRQFFLRVSTDNVDNFTSANVGISADRILDIVVEKPPGIGIIIPSPRIPSELLPSSPEVADSSDLSDETPRSTSISIPKAC